MKKTPLVESIYSKLVNERVTDIVYHGTGLIELRQILEQDKVMTSVAQGVRSDSKLNKDKFFFFSTARSINTFREAFGLPQKAAVMVLDGRKLSQRYKAAAVDYWGPGFLDQDETEDRIVTDDPYIDDFSQYIKEVRILFPVKSFRSVSHAENNSIEKSLDILKAKGIPVKILTKEKYFFINNAKEYMTTKEEWTEFLEKNGYSVGDKRPEDDLGTNLRKATPFNDSAHLAELIKMVENGSLDFSAFPNKKKVTQIKNDLYKHIVDPDGDGIEPKYGDDEDENIKNKMLKGQQVISAQQLQDIYNQVVFYPRDFSTSVGTSIQNSRKDPDARGNLTVISKYMRKNKLKDLETLGVFLKTRINAIKDGRMQKVAEEIMDKMLEKKYDINNPVLMQKSYSEMIHFGSTADLFLPIGEDLLKRALDASPSEEEIFHVTDYRGVYGILNIQGTKRQVAGFTDLGETVADKMFSRGVGAGRSSGFVVKLEGDVLSSFYSDVKTMPEKGGRRNVKLVNIKSSIGHQGFMKLRAQILEKLKQYNDENGYGIEEPENNPYGKGNTAVPIIRAWAKQIHRATPPGPLMTKRYKEQGKPIPKGDGQKVREMVKYYLDSVEEIIKNNKELVMKAIIDGETSEKGGYTGYNEKTIENFRVKSVFLVKDSPAYLGIAESDIVADLEKESIPLHMVSQRQMLNHINGTQNEEIGEKILKKFEEKSDWVPKGVVNRESYSEMIEFGNINNLFFPLGSTLLKRVLGELPENVRGYHIGNLTGMKGLISIQSSKKQISTFTRGAKKEFISDGITGRGGCVAEVEGRLIVSAMKDIFSLPETNGRRNILIEHLGELIRDPDIVNQITDELIEALAVWSEKNAESTVVPKGAEMYKSEVVRAWTRTVKDADGETLHQMIKFYLDTTEAIMKKHSEAIKDALLNPYKGSVQNYDAMDIYDENVMDKIEVKNIYFLDTFYKKRGMPGYPDDEEFKEFIEVMKAQGIDVYKAKAKEIVDMINNSLNKQGATKYFEEEIDWDAFGFSDEERGESEPTDPDLQTLKDLDRGDKFTIGNRKPVYRVIGNNEKGKMSKPAVIDGSAERKFYMIKVVDLPATVGAFEAINAAGDTGDTPRGKVGTVVRVEEELTEAGGDLSYLLLPVGQTQQIGAEKQDKKTKDGIERYSNKFGSYRYVMVMDGEPVGAIQVMSRDKSKGVAANVFVKPELRRQGIAKRLLVQAKKDFDEVEYNPDQSDDGKAWVSSVAEGIYNKILKGL